MGDPVPWRGQRCRVSHGRISVRFLAPVFRGMAKPPARRRPASLSNGRMPVAERTGDAGSNPAHRRHYGCRSARTRCTDVSGFLLACRRLRSERLRPPQGPGAHGSGSLLFRHWPVGEMTQKEDDDLSSPCATRPGRVLRPDGARQVSSCSIPAQRSGIRTIGPTTRAHFTFSL